jgi:hypothetical protein
MYRVSLARRRHEDREVAKITKNYKLSVFVSIVVFELFVMGYRDSCVRAVAASAVVR